MVCDRDRLPLEIVIQSLLGDNTVLCAIVVVRGKASIVINERYSDALDHAQRHLREPNMTVRICSPDCPG